MKVEQSKKSKKKRQKDAEQKHTHRPAHTSDFRRLIKLFLPRAKFTVTQWPAGDADRWNAQLPFEGKVTFFYFCHTSIWVIKNNKGVGSAREWGQVFHRDKFVTMKDLIII